MPQHPTLRPGAYVGGAEAAHPPASGFHTNNITWWSSRRQEWAPKPKVMWTHSGYTKPFFDNGVNGGTDMAYYVLVIQRGGGRSPCSQHEPSTTSLHLPHC